MNQELDFCFKGNRKYVHGTDIYNKLSFYLKEKNILSMSSSFDLSFHGIATKNISITEVLPENTDILKFACKYFDKKENKRVLYGIENNENIDCSYTYDENQIYKNLKFDIDRQEVKLKKDSSFTLIENIVALNKYLLEGLFQDIQGKWYFTRLQLKETLPEETIYPITISLKANFNFKLTKSEIYLDNKSVGFIYFSLV